MKKFLAFAVATFSLVTAAQASLLGRNVNGGAVAAGDPSTVFLYDTTLNVTWLADANLAATEDFGVRFIDLTGYTDADSALKWIGAMNAADYLGFNDWRLPNTLQPDSSCVKQGTRIYFLNCSGSEMGHLFYNELGGVANQDIATTHNANYSLFKNFQSQGFVYWSGTTTAVSQGRGSTWEFDFGKGSQFSGSNGNGAFMLAVRPGDVLAAVPEPSTYALMLAGLAVLGAGAATRRKAS